MRVLLISHGFPPESVGGVEQHVDGLARALQAAGHEVEVWSKTDRPGAQFTTVSDTGGPCPVTRVVYRYEELHSLGDMYRVAELEDALGNFLSSRRFDVAHVHHLTGLSIGAPEVLRAAGIPTAMTLHDYWLMCPRGQMWHVEGRACETVEPEQCGACLAATFGDWLARDSGAAIAAAIHADARSVLGALAALIVPSRRAIPPYAALGVPADRIRTVENGVDVDALRALPPPADDPARPLRVGYLGTLIPSKGLDVLVRAFLALPGGSATLAIHGNSAPYHGDTEFEARALGALSADAGVVHHGPYTTGDLPAILAELDVVVAPALWREAFGLTVREAAAAGRPVVVSRIGGLQDAVEDGVEGFVVPPGEPGELTEALATLADDRPRLVRMGAAARRRVRGFARMADDLLQVYRELGQRQT